MSSTSSTRGFILLVRTWHLRFTGPGMVNQEGTEHPDVEQLENGGGARVESYW